MRTLRGALVVLGVASLGYGGWLLRRWQSPGQLRQVAEWAVAGVVLHDAVFAPVVIGVGWLGMRVLPRRVAAAAAAAGIVVVTLTVTGFAVLGRGGDGGRNHTILDRDYPLGWLLATVAVVAAVGVAAMVGMLVRRARRRHAGGAGHGRR